MLPISQAYHMFNGLDDNECYEKIEYTPLLREAFRGLCEGKHRSMRSMEDKLIEAFIAQHGKDVPVPKSETFEQVRERCKTLMNYLQSSCLNEANEDADGEGGEVKHVLLVSHGGYIKRFLKSVCGLIDVEEINNSSITTVNVSIDSEGNWSCVPVSINNTRHLRSGEDNLMSDSTQ
jgi:broad specificity phosphatase PhoE